VRKQLKAEVEGTCTGKVGFIVKVTGIIDVGDGVILPGGDGKAEFESTYNAVVLKPVSRCAGTSWVKSCAGGRALALPPPRSCSQCVVSAQTGLAHSSRARWSTPSSPT
jgi:hypothetical protein